MSRLPDGCGVGPRMRVRRIRADGDVDRDRYRRFVGAQARCAARTPASPVSPGACPALRPCQARADCLRRSPDSSRARFPRPLRSVHPAEQPPRPRWFARDGDLEIVNRRRAVHHEAGYPSAPHQVQQHIAQAALDDVAAHAPQDRALVPGVLSSARPPLRGRLARENIREAIHESGTPPPFWNGLANWSTRTLPPRSAIGTVFSPSNDSGFCEYRLIAS